MNIETKQLLQASDRMAVLKSTSTRRVWVFLLQTGAQYSAGAYTSAIVDVLSVYALVPHLGPARRWINALHSQEAGP